MFKVLIIEDEKNIRTIISKYLKRFDIACIEAENGVQGLATYIREKDNVDLVLMDVMMPEMDGLEAAKAIRALDRPDAKAIPIIAMTANVFKEDREKCLAAGMNAHLSKPLDAETMKRTISEQLQKRK